jgi:hypothetical protein
MAWLLASVAKEDKKAKATALVLSFMVVRRLFLSFMYDTRSVKHFERILAEFVCARIAALSKQTNCVKRRQKASDLPVALNL